MNFVQFAPKMQERFPSAKITYAAQAEILCVRMSPPLPAEPGVLHVGAYANGDAELCVLCACPESARFSGNVIALSETDVTRVFEIAREIFTADVQLTKGLAELLNLYIAGESDGGLINLLAKLTGFQTALLDTHFILQCQSDAQNKKAPPEYAFRTFSFISDAGQLKNNASLNQMMISDMLVTHVHVNEKTCGYLILSGVTTPVPALASELSAAAAKLLGKSMSTIPAASSPLADESILLELLNATHPSMELRLRMRSAGLRFDQPKRVIVFDANADDPLFENLRASLPSGYATRFKNALVLLTDAALGAAWKQQREEFAKLADEYQLHVGISDAFTGNLNVSVQCRNAFQAIAFADQFHLNATLLDYSDFRFFDLLSLFDQPRELFRYMHPAMQKLRDIDSKSGAVYFHTLHCFLKYNASLSQTSKALYIHRNTLNYRLKRIEELTGLNLDDHKTLFTLNYSYQIAEYLGLVDI